MDYRQTIDYLFSQLPVFQRLGRTAYKANLDNSLILDNYFGNPHRKFRSIHIAGTNGKGSTSHMIASILAKAGYKVGLYTSPHLKDFRERIKINGKVIPKKEVVTFVDRHKRIFDQVKPSFFEMTVALAFDYFARSKVDIAVIEVGLGGRLDSTNIVNPILSLITNISFDHTDILGDTLEKIAIEKAGIIKPSVPVVISTTQPEIKSVFSDKATQVSSPIYFADQIFAVSDLELVDNNYQRFNLLNKQSGELVGLTTDLCGIYQPMNIIGVAMAVNILIKLGLDISFQNIKEGVAVAAKSTGLMGRWQKLNDNPLVICDTGHNIDGIAQVLKQISRINYKQLHFVIGMVADKNIDGILELLPRNAIYYFTKASIPRALDENILADKARLYNLFGNRYKTVKKAYRAAMKNASMDDCIFVGGSTFVVAEVV